MTATFAQVMLILVAMAFFLALIIMLFWIIWKGASKPIKRMLTAMRLRNKKNKLLEDELLLEYCAGRVIKGYSEEDVRKEMLLTNRHSKKRIDEIAYVYNIVNNEINNPVKEKKEVEKEKDGRQKRRFESETSEDYPA